MLNPHFNIQDPVFVIWLQKRGHPTNSSAFPLPFQFPIQPFQRKNSKEERKGRKEFPLDKHWPFALIPTYQLKKKKKKNLPCFQQIPPSQKTSYIYITVFQFLWTSCCCSWTKHLQSFEAIWNSKKKELSIKCSSLKWESFKVHEFVKK